MSKRTRTEAQEYDLGQVESRPLVPQSTDVLLGRGKAIAGREGNKRFQDVIEQNTKRYSEAQTKTDKMRIVIEIVETVKLWGRFLDQPSVMGHWYEADDLKVRKKVGQALRYHLNHPRSTNLSTTTFSTYQSDQGNNNSITINKRGEDYSKDDSSFDISFTGIEFDDDDDDDDKPPLLTDREILAAVGVDHSTFHNAIGNRKKRG
ncbi:hypothetical protein ACA910_011815 [Epithemia clementina (nom. ined.)]